MCRKPLELSVFAGVIVEWGMVMLLKEVKILLAGKGLEVRSSLEGPLPNDLPELKPGLN